MLQTADTKNSSYQMLTSIAIIECLVIAIGQVSMLYRNSSLGEQG